MSTHVLAVLFVCVCFVIPFFAFFFYFFLVLFLVSKLVYYKRGVHVHTHVDWPGI